MCIAFFLSKTAVTLPCNTLRNMLLLLLLELPSALLHWWQERLLVL